LVSPEAEACVITAGAAGYWGDAYAWCTPYLGGD